MQRNLVKNFKSETSVKLAQISASTNFGRKFSVGLRIVRNPPNFFGRKFSARLRKFAECFRPKIFGYVLYATWPNFFRPKIFGYVLHATWLKIFGRNFFGHRRDSNLGILAKKEILFASNWAIETNFNFFTEWLEAILKSLIFLT